MSFGLFSVHKREDFWKYEHPYRILSENKRSNYCKFKVKPACMYILAYIEIYVGGQTNLEKDKKQTEVDTEK